MRIGSSLTTSRKMCIYSSESRHKAKNGVEIPLDMCFYTPKAVYDAIKTHSRVKSWLDYISQEYVPPKEKILLFLYPCSTIKPYPESRSYKTLLKTLSLIFEDQRDKIHVVTVSEPFGLVPEEFYNKFRIWYDCPGLFEWWCKRHKLPYSEIHREKCIEILANRVAGFLVRTREHYRSRVAFVRTFSSNLQRKKDHTHARILEKAVEQSGIPISILPSKKWVAHIVSSSGKFAWDMYGIAHPMAQKFLLHFLNNGGLRI